jgi:murein tripeptide amidase MpaA
LTSTEAEQLLDMYCYFKHRFIFVIIPMVNVDGVIFGNYRTGSAGRDLNRKFREPCKSLYPGVVAMKQLISELHTLYGE